MNKPLKTISSIFRSSFVGATSLAMGTMLLSSCNSGDGGASASGSEEEILVIVSYGGAMQDAQEVAYMEPFMENTGVTIRQEQWTGELAKIKSMVDTNNVSWDLVDIEADLLPVGVAEGLFEKIDPAILPVDELQEDAIFEHAVAGFYWSTVMAYNTDTYNQGNPPPASWSEFWDVESFPGARSLRDGPVGNLEFALLADGVPKDEIYPIDVDRAFASLDKIKPHITLWWQGGAVPATALSDGEVVLASAYSGRVQTKKDDGRPVEVSWNEGALNRDLWVIPKGSPNKERALEFIAFASQAQPQSVFAQNITYGPTNKLAIDQVPAEIVPDLPSAAQNIDKQFIINTDWWADNKADMIERWAEWKL